MSVSTKWEVKPDWAMRARLLHYRWLIVILLASLCINAVGLRWGLPNDNDTWAADSVKPLDPMAFASNAWLDREGNGKWNSGWFFFKFPMAHPFVLLAVQTPYLAWQYVTGQFKSPTPIYPYGFQDPEHALTVLALITRWVSVLMGVGTVTLAYVLASMLFGTSAGLVAAVLVAGCQMFVYFAHTTNVDGPMLFWIALALVATLQCANHGSMRKAMLVGVATGMALFTKEQSLGVLFALPFIWFVWQWPGTHLRWREVMRYVAAAGTAFTVVLVLAGNVWWNAAGFINRWRYLLGILPEDIQHLYAPYKLFVHVPTTFSWEMEVGRLLDVVNAMVQGLTPPILLLCLAGLVWACWHRPRQAVIVLLVIVSYHVFSMRAMAAAPVYRANPLLFCVLILGGSAGGALIERIRELSHGAVRRMALLVVIMALGGALLPGIEIDRLLLKDSRYTAESWLQSHVRNGARVEVYQSPTQLPRFSPDVQVENVPFKERTATLFRQRRPDYVVLSSFNPGGLTNTYVTDWQPGNPMAEPWNPAVEFFEHLRAEQLNYCRVAWFHELERWPTTFVNRLNPGITIFAPC